MSGSGWLRGNVRRRAKDSENQIGDSPPGWITMTEPPTAEERRARNFLRRSRAAQEGRHLPSLAELLLEMPFFSNDILEDSKEFAERLMARLALRSSTEPDHSHLKEALAALTMMPLLDEFRAAAHLLREIQGTGYRSFREFAVRCDLYAASFGCEESALRIAAEAAVLAERDIREIGDEEASILVRNALGWLRSGDGYARAPGKRRVQIASIGEGLLRLATRPSDPPGRRDASGPGDQADRDLFRIPRPRPERTENQKEASDGPAAVVFSEIGSRETSEGRRVAQSFDKLVGRPLPLVACSDLAPVLMNLLSEFPYAEMLVHTVLDEVAVRPYVALRPIVLVGPPGTGKTRFAKRTLGLLGVPTQVYSCGGVADASLAGTARGWSTGEPSLPVSLIRQYECASPGIILDEIEKVGSSRHNGNVLDALLGLLEPESSKNWRDPYLEAPVNLAYVIWIATANTIEGLPLPLRDRCRILEYSGPDSRHLEELATKVLTEMMTERGLDARWASPLSGDELEAIARSWEGGSIRVLRRLVEGVMNVRERLQLHH